jgi:hypothetical protein
MQLSCKFCGRAFAANKEQKARGWGYCSSACAYADPARGRRHSKFMRLLWRNPRYRANKIRAIRIHGNSAKERANRSVRASRQFRLGSRWARLAGA